MEKAAIIKKIIQHKKQPNLKFQLKEKTEAFTKRLLVFMRLQFIGWRMNCTMQVFR